MDIVISKPIELVALLLILLCTQTVGLQLRRVRDSSWAVEDDECCQWSNNRMGRVERLLLLRGTQDPRRGNSSTGFGCLKKERDALLDFKSGLDDPSNRLSSWVKDDDDCCRWAGVRCNNRTGHVERLHLRGPQLSMFDDDDEYMFGDQYILDDDKMLGGEIRPSLLDLTHLKHLDLSLNNFSAMIGIPVFLGSFKELRYLNLSRAGFNGRVPTELGNLSTLQHLDLSDGRYYFIPSGGVHNNLEVEDTRWLSRLTSLRHLDMSDVWFKKASSSHNWLHALTMLPSILEIRLYFCEFDSPLPSSLPHHNNFTSLSILDLSWNGFNSTIPEWLCSLTSLSYLDLRDNQFYGHIPAALGNMTSLEYLDLSENDYLDGEIPKTLANLCNLSTFCLSDSPGVSGFLDELQEVFTGCMSNNLETLELYGTNLTGRIPDWLGGLVSLQSLDLGGNMLTGSIPASLGNLVSLQYLVLGGNKLTGNIPASLGNLVSLQSLYLSDNKLTGNIPKTLGRLSNLTGLDLGWNNLEGILTEEHFTNLAKLKSIDISGNPPFSLALKVSSTWNPPFRLDTIVMGSCLLGRQFPAWLRTQENYTRLDMSNAWISDTIPDWFWNLSTRFESLDLSGNKIGGKLQSLTSNQTYIELDLSDNLFSGPIPPSMWEAMPHLNILSLSTNRINGSIPLSICKATDLASLDLSNNFLSGELPKCWEKLISLLALNMSNNNLSGGLPSSICMFNNLKSLHLGSNILSGELFSLSNCTELVELDLSGNRFNGSIPPWIGQNLSSLKILSLHSNNLSGTIPSHLSNLTALQILDLSQNQLSGFIPQSFGNFTAMKFKHNIIDANNIYPYTMIAESMMLSMKGRELQYNRRLLTIVVTIDLSNNKLHGSVPKQVGNLIGLMNLNLSGNQLSGEIIEELGQLQQLESLDLSKNKFSGRIPTSLSNIYSLSSFNLSYNNLSGRIPSGDQLQTFDASSYIGNDYLCGKPLIKKCPGDETPPTIWDGFSTDEETEGNDDIVWIYSTIAPGFVVGLLAFFGVLALKRKWRITYFRFIDYIYDTIYVAIAIKIKKLKRGKPKISNHGLARRN